MSNNGRTTEGIKAALRTVISAPGLPLSQIESFTDDDSFMEKGILDSTGVLEIVSHIEKEYGIRVEAEEIIPDNLDSINKLTVFIERKMGGRGAGA